jgi:hypothetical protein
MSEVQKPNHNPLTEVIDIELLKKIDRKRENINNKFPLWSALAATFGVVSIFYGFEKLINEIPVLANNPWILLLFGLAVLIATGTTYKKL